MTNKKQNRWLSYAIAIAAAAILGACGGGKSGGSGTPGTGNPGTGNPGTGNPSTPNRPPQTLPPVLTPGDVPPVGQTDASVWDAVLWEEFEENELNSFVWNDHIWYLESHPVKNYAVEDGMLKIWPEAPFEDRFIDTDGKFEVVYGYFEMRARLPIGKGVWPAFWLYAHPGNDRPEIDIMEAYSGGGVDSYWSDANLHPVNYGYTMHESNMDGSHHIVHGEGKLRDNAEWASGPDLSADFYVYAAEWSPAGTQFYFEGKPVGPLFTGGANYFSKPMYVILDIMYGSASGEPDSSTPTGKSNSFEIDYVRAWQRK